MRGKLPRILDLKLHILWNTDLHCGNHHTYMGSILCELECNGGSFICKNSSVQFKIYYKWCAQCQTGSMLNMKQRERVAPTWSPVHHSPVLHRKIFKSADFWWLAFHFALPTSTLDWPLKYFTHLAAIVLKITAPYLCITSHQRLYSTYLHLQTLKF